MRDGAEVKLQGRNCRDGVEKAGIGAGEGAKGRVVRLHDGIGGQRSGLVGAPRSVPKLVKVAGCAADLRPAYCGVVEVGF